MILALETAILDRLKAKLPAHVLVEAFPDEASAFDRLPWDSALVLVSYKSSQFALPLGMGALSQDRTLQFEVQLCTKGDPSHQGAYAYLDAIREALSGFRPGASGILYPLTEAFIRAEGPVWTYAQVYACTAAFIESREALSEVPMRHATFVNERFGDTLEIPNDEA